MIVSFAFCGSIFAQYESHWPYNYHMENGSILCAAFAINGHVYTVDDEGWDALEVAFFVTNSSGQEEHRGGAFLDRENVDYYGDPYPITAGNTIDFTTPGEVAHFKLWDHINGVLYEQCEVTYQGEPMTIVTGVDHNEAYTVEPYDPIILNFIGDVTFTKDIVGYGDSDGGYYLIASPVVEEVTPSAENGFLTTAYDLYFFDGSQEGKEWQNFHEGEDSHGPFNLVNGKGYLYASQTNTTLTFTGTPYEGDTLEVTLSRDANTPWGGWNLVGNPFADCGATFGDRPYYKMNETGTGFIAYNGNSRAEGYSPSLYDLDPMEGAFVIADYDGETLTITKDDGMEEAELKDLYINLTKSCIRGTVDRAIVNFGEGGTLPKFQMNPNHSKVYIPQDGTDYAVVNAPEMGEMPVNFKAEANGSYTMSFGSENVTFSYLHLIDNLTGADVDLLATPSYTFDASTTDYASRFRLVFATGDNSDDDSFAFFSNGSFVVSNEGEATLQVVDVMGRILKSENISGSASVKVDAASGVYMLRLVNGNDVKVQKVVVE